MYIYFPILIGCMTFSQKEKRRKEILRVQLDYYLLPKKFYLLRVEKNTGKFGGGGVGGV